jgi:hypothetical protein
LGYYEKTKKEARVKYLKKDSFEEYDDSASSSNNSGTNENATIQTTGTPESEREREKFKSPSTRIHKNFVLRGAIDFKTLNHPPLSITRKK